MGMSSSQARLLNLTSRMHQIEYKAAKTQAEKLQMANHTARVREEYLNALEETRIQYGRLNSEGAVEYHNASANILQNGCIPTYDGEHSADPLFLQSPDGVIWVTPAVKAYYQMPDRGEDLPGLDEYLIARHHQQSEHHVMGTRPIANSVASFSPIPNGTIQPYHPAVMHYVVNTSTIARNSEGVTHHDDIIDFEDNATYRISNEAELKKFFQAVNGRNLTNVTLELTANINMSNSALSDYTPPTCSGITFDGNGHTISNMTKPLFNSISNSTIENLNLTTGTTFDESNNTGLIARTVTSGGTTKLNNIRVVNQQISSHNGGNSAGALVGANSGSLEINDSYIYEVSISSGASSGGLVGTSSGTLKVSNTIVKASCNFPNGYGGLILGNNTGGSNAVTLENTAWTQGTGNADKPVGHGGASSYIPGEPTVTEGTVNYTGEYDATAPLITIIGSHNEYDTSLGEIPTINSDGTGGFYSNIIALLTVRNNEVPNDSLCTKVKNYLKNTSINPNTNAGNQELYNLNQNIVTYLSNVNSNTQDEDFATALINDITHSPQTKTYTVEGGYRSGGTTFVDVTRTGSNSTCTLSQEPSVEEIPGEIPIPHIDTIRDGILRALQKIDRTTAPTREQIGAYLANYDPSDPTDFLSLAYINQMVNAYASGGSPSQLITLRSNIQSNTLTTGCPTGVNPAEISHYNLTMAASPQTVAFDPEMEEYDTGVVDYYYWDTSNQAIAQDIAIWYLSQRGVDYLTDEQSDSAEYLTNSINAGEYVLTTFEPENVQLLASLQPEQIAELTDSEYNELLGIVNTSVATNTNLQEVQYTEEIRQAEAKYEADMRKIDKKERKYDKDLATYENERNAIKQEIETLKTVSKENVDRTFKVFS